MGGIGKGIKAGLDGAKNILKSGVKLAEGKPDEAFASLHNGVMDGLKGGHHVAKAVVPVAGTVVGGMFGGPAGAMLGSEVGNMAANDMSQLDSTFDQMKIATNDNDFGPRNGDIAAGTGVFV